MAGGREIKTKIKSVQNTRKVTRALEMVSASKIRKAQDRMKASRPYARLMRKVIGHIAQRLQVKVEALKQVQLPAAASRAAGPSTRRGAPRRSGRG